MHPRDFGIKCWCRILKRYQQVTHGAGRHHIAGPDGAVKWWHRNVAKASYGMGLQGWKRGCIYPDFIFATGGNAGAGRIVVLETKGDHLQNPDTYYKRDVLDFLTQNFSWGSGGARRSATDSHDRRDRGMGLGADGGNSGEATGALGTLSQGASCR